MPDNIPQKQPPAENSGYEKRDINMNKIALYAVLSVLVVAVVLIFLLDYYTAVREEIVYEAVLKPISTDLRELKAREAEELGSYKLLDKEKGIYQIPIERAMMLMAEDAYGKWLLDDADK